VHRLIAYASRTGTRRNLDALGRAGWRLLVSRGGVWRIEEWVDQIGARHRFRFCLDNGAWADFTAGRDFDEDRFERFLAWAETQGVTPDFLVLPDIVAGGMASLSLSARYLNRCLAVAPLVLIAVQDGMTADDLAPMVGPNVGIFLGGSTPWKLTKMQYWGQFCAEHGIWYHVARVNTDRRIRMAVDAGAHSIDGSSASRYAVTLPRLVSSIENAERQCGFFTINPGEMRGSMS
jgi:hypothetical protein